MLVSPSDFSSLALNNYQLNDEILSSYYNQDPWNLESADQSKHHPSTLASKNGLSNYTSSENKLRVLNHDGGLVTSQEFRTEFSPLEKPSSWQSQLELETNDVDSKSDDDHPVDLGQDSDTLGILDYLRSDQEIQEDLELYYDQLAIENLSPPSEQSTFTSLNHPNNTRNKTFHEISIDNNHDYRNRLLSCSSCGVIKSPVELSRLWPCFHPHCNTCINTLINASCNDPPPSEMVCFFCGQHITGFDPPISFVSSQSSRLASLASTKSLSPGWFDLDGIEHSTIISPSSDASAAFLRSFTSGPGPGAGNEIDKLISKFANQTMSPSFITTAPGSSCVWPLVRVDNISWSLTVADIVRWLPDGLECLPPSELCALPIHILCTPADGKTLNHCFIEMRDLASAHSLVRRRHGTKIGMRPCSVVLTSSSELHSKILGTKPDETPLDLMTNIKLILKLCAPHSPSSIKAPERPFYHLISILLHCEHMSEGSPPLETLYEIGCVKKWTSILPIAIKSLFECEIGTSELMTILRVMVDAALSSPLVDHGMILQFLSGLETDF